MFDLQSEFKKRQEKLRKTLDDAYSRHKVRSWFDELNKKAYLQALDESGVKTVELAKVLTEEGLKFYGEAKYMQAADSFRRALKYRTVYFGENAVEREDSLYQYGLSLVKLTLEQGRTDGHNLQKSFDTIADEFSVPDSHKPSVSIALFLKALAEGYVHIGDFVAARQIYTRACIMSRRSYTSGGPITPADITLMYFETALCIQRSRGNIGAALEFCRRANAEAERILFDANASQTDREKLDGFLQRVQNLIVELKS